MAGMATTLSTDPQIAASGGSAIVNLSHGLLLRTGEIIESEVTFSHLPAFQEREDYVGFQIEVPGPPTVEIRIRALLHDNTRTDIFTEAACLADDLEAAGNGWGAQVVRRLAGITAGG
jgi:hypothetical protein